MTIEILWPVFALVAWIYGVWFVMYVQRLALMRRTPPTEADFATKEAGGNISSRSKCPRRT